MVQGAVRRGACNQAQRYANDWGTGLVRDRYWVINLKASPLYDSSTTDAEADWPDAADIIDIQSGLTAGNLHELRRRIRAQGPDVLARPEDQIFRTCDQLATALDCCHDFASTPRAAIALIVEIAAGRIDTDDGLPTTGQLRGLAKIHLESSGFGLSSQHSLQY